MNETTPSVIEETVILDDEDTQEVEETQETEDTQDVVILDDENAQEVEEECAVCLSKQIVTDSLPYLAKAVRDLAMLAAQGEICDYEYLSKSMTSLSTTVAVVRDTIKTLEQCDCENSDEPETEPVYSVSAESQREYDV